MTVSIWLKDYLMSIEEIFRQQIRLSSFFGINVNVLLFGSQLGHGINRPLIVRVWLLHKNTRRSSRVLIWFNGSKRLIFGYPRKVQLNKEFLEARTYTWTNDIGSYSKGCTFDRQGFIQANQGMVWSNACWLILLIDQIVFVGLEKCIDFQWFLSCLIRTRWMIRPKYCRFICGQSVLIKLNVEIRFRSRRSLQCSRGNSSIEAR